MIKSMSYAVYRWKPSLSLDTIFANFEIQGSGSTLAPVVKTRVPMKMHDKTLWNCISLLNNRVRFFLRINHWNCLDLLWLTPRGQMMKSFFNKINLNTLMLTTTPAVSRLLNDVYLEWLSWNSQHMLWYIWRLRPGRSSGPLIRADQSTDRTRTNVLWKWKMDKNSMYICLFNKQNQNNRHIEN